MRRRVALFLLSGRGAAAVPGVAAAVDWGFSSFMLTTKELPLTKLSVTEVPAWTRIVNVCCLPKMDVVGLVDFLDFIFLDGQELSFPEFMDVVLQLRGCNRATVRSEMRRTLGIPRKTNGNT